MKDLVVGVDCSTTATKAVIWDRDGRAVAEGRGSIDLENPSPGAWLQNAEQWWSATQRAIGESMVAAGADAANRLAALCIANQRETFVVTDGAGAPLHPALVWMDARCHDQVVDVTNRVGRDRLIDISGKPPCTTPSLYKLLYVLDEHPELRKGERRVLDVHASLVWRLTGDCATSLAAADPTGLVDMKARRWSSELLALAHLDESNVPRLVEPGDVIANVTPEAAAACGLPAGLPVVAGAGDGQAAGLGAGLAPGRAYLNLGTAVVSGVESADYLTSDAFRTLFGAAPGTFFLETDLQGGTFTITWLVDRVLRRGTETSKAFDEIRARLESLAASEAPGAGGLLLVPYWNGVMNPYWDGDASGLLVGVRGDHGAEHVYRAILEGIAFEQHLHTCGVERALDRPIDEYVAMGGGSKSDLWCQIVADVSGRSVTRAGTTEATSLGAGILAATAAELHPDVATAMSAMTRDGETFRPGEHAEAYERLYRTYKELYPAARKVMGDLARFRSGR